MVKGKQMTTSAQDSNLYQLLLSHYGDQAIVERQFVRLEVPVSTLKPAGQEVSRLELAQALNMLLFEQLLQQVASGRDYVDDAERDGVKICFDHGAVRTVRRGRDSGFPDGETLFTKVLLPLGYQQSGTYPLARIKMTGRVYTHVDDAENIAQFFVSELHPEQFSPQFQQTVEAVLASSRSPLSDEVLALLAQLEAQGKLALDQAKRLLPAMLACFARHHDLPTVAQYETLKAESAEMAWISTEGNAFNHATDRVGDVVATAERQRQLGRPIKDQVEVSRNGRVRQTAFRAVKVDYQMQGDDGQPVAMTVPGSFYEFISRDHYLDEAGQRKLDLSFDSGNAQGIFKMTAAVPAGDEAGSVC
ncbi:hypothetical protein HFRIS_020841 [Herbaspirillum frisingense GSF30]|uniref:2-oxoadipate dioxygenase/decarboxylase n=2 Tax=Herbaspirillum frisingense TaxID=92645 RepID=A0AAI9N279_9BURK|nr:hypothetical protein HFRIS_020841 [Herbaspirillum frisingense GSF30]